MEDFDINSFKSAVINTIVENNEIIFNLDKEYIDAGGGLLYKKIFLICRIQRPLRKPLHSSVSRSIM